MNLNAPIFKPNFATSALNDGAQNKAKNKKKKENSGKPKTEAVKIVDKTEKNDKGEKKSVATTQQQQQKKYQIKGTAAAAEKVDEPLASEPVQEKEVEKVQKKVEVKPVVKEEKVPKNNHKIINRSQ